MEEVEGSERTDSPHWCWPRQKLWRGEKKLKEEGDPERNEVREQRRWEMNEVRRTTKIGEKE